MRSYLGRLVGTAIISAVLFAFYAPLLQAENGGFQRIPTGPTIGRVAIPPLDLRPMVRPRGEAEIDLDRLKAPDIVIDEIRFSPGTYVPPEQIRVQVILHNDGIEPSGPFHVRWRPYETHPGIVHYVPSLRHGVGGDVVFEHDFTTATEDTFAEVDCYDEVAERNESNNEAQAHPLIGAEAWDFYVEDVWLVDPAESLTEPVLYPVGGEDLELCFRVGFVNTVNDDRLSPWVDVYVDGESRYSWHFHIPANRTQVNSFPLNVGGGEHTVRVTACEPIEEASQANNELVKTFTWRSRPHRPYRFEYFAIDDYEALGGGGNLPFSVNEGRRFYWKMVDNHHTCLYAAEDAAVQCEDWGYQANARVNWADIAYYAGHGDYNGPWYSHYGADDAGVLQMEPDKYLFGKNAADEATLRWCVWSACSTLYDGVEDASRVNWWDSPYPLSRWFPTFQGLHSIMGMRSLGWQGEWYEASSCYYRDTRQRARRFVDKLHNGYTFSHAWFMAQRETVYDQMDQGFEAGMLAADTEGVNYIEETFWDPFPDYVGTPSGFYVVFYRIGSPSW